MSKDKRLELLELENEILKSQNEKLLATLIETQGKLKEWLERLEQTDTKVKVEKEKS